MSTPVVSSIDRVVAELARFEPRTCSPDECVTVVQRLARLEKACAAARARAAVRVTEAGAHRGQGFVNPADWLARATGVSSTQAERELRTAEQLDQLPQTRAALDRGELSLAQAHEIAATVAVCPGSEQELVDTARTESLRSLRDQGRKRRLAAISADDLHQRQRAARFHRHWRDELGMIRYTGALLPETGVPFTNRLDTQTDREWRRARRTGQTDTREQLAADAFAQMITGGGSGQPVRADVVFVCDVTTGATHIVGGGPVPHTVVREAARDGFIKAVLHDGVQVDTVVHYGRKKIPAILRTVLELGDPPQFDGVTCCEPNCDRRYGLEWDHADPVAHHGPTSRTNLKPRCHDCHQTKTEQDRLAGLLGDAIARGRSP